MRVELNGESLHDRVLNEALFCHASPAATSRYILRVARADGAEPDVLADEEQKSSGLWVGPAAGSTAAQRSAGGSVLPLDVAATSSTSCASPIVRTDEPLKRRSGSWSATRRSKSRAGCARRASSSTAITWSTTSRSATSSRCAAPTSRSSCWDYARQPG